MEEKKKRHPIGRILLLIPVVLIALLISLYIVCPFINDAVAENVVKEMKAKPLPEKTVIVEEISEAGKLVGNGNGMQYFGALLLKSDVPLEELKAYYSQFSDKWWAYVVEKQNDGEIKEVEHDRLFFKTNIDEENYYILYTWGDYDGFASEFDLRGH